MSTWTARSTAAVVPRPDNRRSRLPSSSSPFATEFSSQRWPCPFLFSPLPLGRASSVVCGLLPAMAECRRHARFCNGVFFVVLFFLILLHFSAPVSARRLLFYSGWKDTLPSLHFLSPGARSFIVDISILICARSFIAEISILISASGIYENKVLWRR